MGRLWGDAEAVDGGANCRAWFGTPTMRCPVAIQEDYDARGLLSDMEETILETDAWRAKSVCSICAVSALLPLGG